MRVQVSPLPPNKSVQMPGTSGILSREAAMKTITAARKAELKKAAQDAGISYEAMLGAEKFRAIYAEGGVEALRAAGYHVGGQKVD